MVKTTVMVKIVKPSLMMVSGCCSLHITSTVRILKPMIQPIKAMEVAGMVACTSLTITLDCGSSMWKPLWLQRIQMIEEQPTSKPPLAGTSPTAQMAKNSNLNSMTLAGCHSYGRLNTTMG